MTNQIPPIYGLAFGSAIQTVNTSTRTLLTLSLSNNEFIVGSSPGTLIGSISGTTLGSSLMFQSSISGAVQLLDNTIQVGNTPPIASGTFNITLIEVLDAAINSPNFTTIAISAIDGVPVINTPPTVLGTPFVGNPFTAGDAIWDGVVTDRIYQWKVDGINGTGGGSTSLSYTPVSGDIGKTLTITVTAINSGGHSSPSTSDESAAVVSAVSDVLKISLELSVCSVPILS